MNCSCPDYGGAVKHTRECYEARAKGTQDALHELNNALAILLAHLELGELDEAQKAAPRVKTALITVNMEASNGKID